MINSYFNGTSNISELRRNTSYRKYRGINVEQYDKSLLNINIDFSDAPRQNRKKHIFRDKNLRKRYYDDLIKKGVAWIGGDYQLKPIKGKFKLESRANFFYLRKSKRVKYPNIPQRYKKNVVSAVLDEFDKEYNLIYGLNGSVEKRFLAECRKAMAANTGNPSLYALDIFANEPEHRKDLPKLYKYARQNYDLISENLYDENFDVFNLKEAAQKSPDKQGGYRYHVPVEFRNFLDQPVHTGHQWLKRFKHAMSLANSDWSMSLFKAAIPTIYGWCIFKNKSAMFDWLLENVLQDYSVKMQLAFYQAFDKTYQRIEQGKAVSGFNGGKPMTILGVKEEFWGRNLKKRPGDDSAYLSAELIRRIKAYIGYMYSRRLISGEDLEGLARDGVRISSRMFAEACNINQRNTCLKLKQLEEEGWLTTSLRGGHKQGGLMIRLNDNVKLDIDRSNPVMVKNYNKLQSILNTAFQPKVSPLDIRSEHQDFNPDGATNSNKEFKGELELCEAEPMVIEVKTHYTDVENMPKEEMERLKRKRLKNAAGRYNYRTKQLALSLK